MHEADGTIRLLGIPNLRRYDREKREGGKWTEQVVERGGAEEIGYGEEENPRILLNTILLHFKCDLTHL